MCVISFRGKANFSTEVVCEGGLGVGHEGVWERGGESGEEGLTVLYSIKVV